MLPWLLAASPMILHFLFPEDPVHCGLRCYVLAFIRKCGNNFTGRHAGKALLVDRIKNLLPLFRFQLIGRIAVIGIGSAVFIRLMILVQSFPSVIRPLRDAYAFAGLFESGTVLNCLVNKLYCFTAIRGAY